MSRIALIGDNSIEYVNMLLDIWRHGHSAVLIDWRIPIETSVQMMKEAGVNSCIIEKRYFTKINCNLYDDITFFSYERSEEIAQILPSNVYEKYVNNYSYEEAVVIYSSGTTGKARGIILSHYAINTNADAIIDYMFSEKKECIYIVKTLSHSSTLIGELIVALKTNTKLVIGPIVVPPRTILRNIDKFEVSIVCLNPVLLSMIKAECLRGIYKIEKLKKIYVSGSLLGNKLCSEARTILNDVEIYNVYGLTEAGPRVSAQRIDCCTENSVGKPIKGVEIAIVDENGFVVKKGQSGLVHVNTPSRFIGYITGKVKNASLYKNWINTGDIGFVNSNNELCIVGRNDDVINIYAHKIYPNDIEEKIKQVSSILECVVVKVELESNEFIACLYTAKQEECDIRLKLMDILPIYEIPRVFIRSSLIPYTSTGKISRVAAQEQIIKILTGEINNGI